MLKCLINIFGILSVFAVFVEYSVVGYNIFNSKNVTVFSKTTPSLREPHLR
jgi:hypothetical protein